jgi:hypothetical protein
MEKTLVRVPVVCPQCGKEWLTEFSAVVTALPYIYRRLSRIEGAAEQDRGEWQVLHRCHIVWRSTSPEFAYPPAVSRLELRPHQPQCASARVAGVIRQRSRFSFRTS